MEFVLEKLSSDKVFLTSGVEQCTSISFDFATINLEDNFNRPSEIFGFQRSLVKY